MGPAPDIRTPLPGPNARAIVERDGRAVSPSYTRAYPFVMARGEGAVLEDVDGNLFIDCAAGIAVASTGHAHPRVVSAVTEQAGRFLHMSGTDFYYELQVRLAEEIAALAPVAAPAVSFFGNFGTEANEAAIKLARYHSGRFNLLALFGAFHGRTLGSLALTARWPKASRPASRSGS
jgi:4-aminobutyrate aminotransferase